MLVRMWRKRDTSTLLVRIEISATTKESNMEIPQKLKIALPDNPVISLLGTYPKECASGYDRATCTSMFTAALFTKTKLWKQLRGPITDEWNKKMWYIYTWSFIQS
jgi:hypothetical protein